MVSTTAFVVVSSTMTAAMVRASSHTLTYARRPSGLKAMNWGGPASILMVAVTLSTAVSTTVTVPASRLATYSWRPPGGATRNPGVSPTGIVARSDGIGTAVATAVGVAG